MEGDKFPADPAEILLGPDMSQAKAQSLFPEKSTDGTNKDTTHQVDDTWVAARGLEGFLIDANMT